LPDKFHLYLIIFIILSIDLSSFYSQEYSAVRKT
jgi:hypothetical protein